MTVYISRDDSYALEHYGVKGMKWGVRHDKERQSVEAKPIRPSESKRTGITRDSATKIATTRYKIKKNQWRMSRYGNRDALSRAANDFRRVRGAHLEKTLNNREAKAEYLQNPTRENKKRLDRTRKERAKNIATSAAASLVAPGILGKGAYQRYRKNGNAVVKSILKTAGTTTVRGLASSYGLGGAAAVTSVIGRRVNPTRPHNPSNSNRRVY